jgi:hypothetical protein
MKLAMIDHSRNDPAFKNRLSGIPGRRNSPDDDALRKSASARLTWRQWHAAGLVIHRPAVAASGGFSDEQEEEEEEEEEEEDFFTVLSLTIQYVWKKPSKRTMRAAPIECSMCR